MEPFTIDTILPIASGALFTTQAVYYLGLYNKLYTHSRETAYATDINTQNPPLSVIIAELMKERRRLYRNGGRETGEERLSEINEELKRLRKEVRMTVQIEKHSLEIEARLQEAEEQSQNEKRVEDKERMQKSQEVR